MRCVAGTEPVKGKERSSLFLAFGRVPAGECRKNSIQAGFSPERTCRRMFLKS
jgi:hypothetical protein